MMTITFQQSEWKHFMRLSQSTDTLSSACVLPPLPLPTHSPRRQQQISQNQTQKTARLSIQSCNCLLKAIKIARLAHLLLVSSGSPSPVPQSFLSLLSFQSLLVQASPSPPSGFIFLFSLP